LKSLLRVPATLAIIFILLCAAVPVQAGSNKAAVFNSIQFIANLETIGVAVSGTGLPATAELSYRPSGETEWRKGHPLVRIKDGRLIGSLFNLLPATSYDVIASDPIGTLQIKGSVTTQSDQLSFTPTRTIYVDDDVPPGGNGSIVLPFQTIQEAVDHAGPGTRVSVADGTYREAVTFPASGTPGKWINVYSPADVIASNFRNDPDRDVANQFLDLGKQSPLQQSPLPNSNTVYSAGVDLNRLSSPMATLTLMGIKAHANYWDEDLQADTCFNLFVRQLGARELSASPQMAASLA